MRLRTAIESLPFDFFIIDKNGRYVMQNSTCRDRWGDVIGKRTEDLEVDEDNLTLWLNNNRRAFAGEVIKDEVELKVKEGKGFFYNIIAPVTDGDRVPEILGVNIDITERKRAEEELRKAHDEMEQKVKERTSELLETNEQLRREIKNRKGVEERLRESEAYIKGILNAAPIGIGLVHSRVISWTSDPLCSMLGYSEDELIGQSARIAYESDEEFQRVGEVKYSEIQERGVGTVETCLKRKDGSILDILLCSAAIDPEDFSKGTIFTALDITARKQAEEALRESEKELREQTKALEEANIALQVLLGHRDEEKKRLEDTILGSLQKLITPYLQRFKETTLSTEQKALVDILEANLSEVSSPFTDKLSSKCAGITPRELEIAGLIKAGKRNVEIADLLGITENAVSFHRKNLRSKLELKHKKVNLRSYLLSLV
jgi:PAS domain S-box-containing protein